jgi:separase
MSPKTTSRDWWQKKESLDRQLAELLADFEHNVLGAWKGLLTPLMFEGIDDSVRSAVLAAIEMYPPDKQKLVRREAERALGIKDSRSKAYRCPQCIGKYPIALLLGKYMNRIPWECLPCVLQHEISVTRVPSLKLLAMQGQQQLPRSINLDSAFYVLNPAGDLEMTETMFMPLFARLPWNGVVRVPPDKHTIDQVFRQKDLLVYCGHGSGNEYCNYESLIEEQRPCRSSLFLMGCGSGELNDMGEMDPVGAPYYCVAAGSGAVVANLWNVTDREIDRFFMALLKQTLKCGNHKLEDAVAVARKACRLRYLTGGAPVVYGFPTVVQRTR